LDDFDDGLGKSKSIKMSKIYIITHADWWKKWSDSEVYESPTLVDESFIHLCTEAQLSGVLERYFQGQSNLLKLHIDSTALDSNQLKYEIATGNDLFPHYYGQIPKAAIVEVEKID